MRTVPRSASQSRIKWRSFLSRTASCNLLEPTDVVPIQRDNSDQEEEEQEKEEEQGQAATRRISQHDQHTLIRVRPPPRFTIPYQEGRP